MSYTIDNIKLNWTSFKFRFALKLSIIDICNIIDYRAVAISIGILSTSFWPLLTVHEEFVNLHNENGTRTAQSAILISPPLVPLLSSRGPPSEETRQTRWLCKTELIAWFIWHFAPRAITIIIVIAIKVIIIKIVADVVVVASSM